MVSVPDISTATITCFNADKPLSNFYTFRFSWAGQTFKSFEHAYCYEKATRAENGGAAFDVLHRCLTAAEAKSRTKGVQPDD